GELVPAVLALALPVHLRLDGGEPLRRRADCHLRRRFAHGRRGIRHPAGHDHLSAGSGLTSAAAVGMDWKGKASAVAYMVAVAAAYARPSVAQAIYGLVAMLWLVPDRRIERTLAANGEP